MGGGTRPDEMIHALGEVVMLGIVAGYPAVTVYPFPSLRHEPAAELRHPALAEHVLVVRNAVHKQDISAAAPNRSNTLVIGKGRPYRVLQERLVARKTGPSTRG